jgi:hypothetical protein
VSVSRAVTSDKNVPDRPPILVDEVEASRMFGVSRPTFRGLVAQGLIPKATLPGLRRNLYRLCDLEELARDLVARASSKST